MKRRTNINVGEGDRSTARMEGGASSRWLVARPRTSTGKAAPRPPYSVAVASTHIISWTERRWYVRKTLDNGPLNEKCAWEKRHWTTEATRWDGPGSSGIARPQIINRVCHGSLFTNFCIASFSNPPPRFITGRGSWTLILEKSMFLSPGPCWSYSTILPLLSQFWSNLKPY